MLRSIIQSCQGNPLSLAARALNFSKRSFLKVCKKKRSVCLEKKHFYQKISRKILNHSNIEMFRLVS